MKRTIVAVALSLLSVSAFAGSAYQSVNSTQITNAEGQWSAYRENAVKVCGLGLQNGQHRGVILAKGESPDGQDVQFVYKTNAKQIDWKITDAKVTTGEQALPFGANLLSGTVDKDDSSLFVEINGSSWDEMSWNESSVAHNFPTTQGEIKLQPKINILASDFAQGTTNIESKIVVTCSN